MEYEPFDFTLPKIAIIIPMLKLKINKIIDLEKNREKLDFYYKNIRKIMKKKNILNSYNFYEDFFEKIIN